MEKLVFDKIKIDSNSWYNIRSVLNEELFQKSILNYKEHKVKETHSRLIYHYASIDTLKAIVSSQCIHATNISYVNDSTELNYAHNLFIENINKMLNIKKTEFEKHVLNKLLSKFEKIEKSNRYISCYSINGDLKYQWGNYCNNGYGVSIGFNSHNLKSLLEPSSANYYILYNKDEQEKIINFKINNILDYFNKYNILFDWDIYDPILLISNEIYEYCEMFFCHFKDAKYKNEKEYRFEIKTDRLPNYKPFIIEYKERDGNKIPYIANKTDYQRKFEKNNGVYDYEYDIEYNIGKLPIEEIIVGYNLDFDKIKLQLTEFFKDQKYYHVVIKKSKYFKSQNMN